MIIDTQDAKKDEKGKKDDKGRKGVVHACVFFVLRYINYVVFFCVRW